ncbi:MAG: hypothetical protein ACO373_02585, partial [Pontimonas sp.]
QTGEIYAGLLDKLISFCDNYNYKFELLENKYYGLPGEMDDGISLEGVRDYMKSICAHEPRDYQIQGVYDALKYKRKLTACWVLIRRRGWRSWQRRVASVRM